MARTENKSADKAKFRFYFLACSFFHYYFFPLHQQPVAGRQENNAGVVKALGKLLCLA